MNCAKSRLAWVLVCARAKPTASKPMSRALARMASRSVIGVLAASVIRGKGFGEGARTAGSDGGAQVRHEFLVEGDIVPSQQHQPENLLALHEMVEIGAA